MVDYNDDDGQVIAKDPVLACRFNIGSKLPVTKFSVAERKYDILSNTMLHRATSISLQILIK